MASDDWNIPCLEGDDLEPSPEELEKMYVGLENDIIPSLEWKCLGRRAPSPVAVHTPEVAEVFEKDSLTKNQDYDFMDEAVQPQIRVRHSLPKGSAKKKTTNFAGVIDSMKKHGRLLHKAESTADKHS